MRAPPAPDGERKSADADLLGEATVLHPPIADNAGEPGEVAEAKTPVAPVAPAMPEPPPAEDENQPGFIGERNRPAP